MRYVTPEELKYVNGLWNELADMQHSPDAKHGLMQQEMANLAVAIMRWVPKLVAECERLQAIVDEEVSG